MRESEVQEFMTEHQVGYCLKPKDVEKMAFQSIPKQFMTPSKVDCRQYVTPTEDQGSNPWCAAYSASSWAESILWQKQGWWDHIQPDWIYKKAKTTDGIPDQDGTTLTAALEALRGPVFDETTTKVRVIKSTRLAMKFALHQYGIALAGFQITRPWYEATKDNDLIDTESHDFLGGHAVLIAGYDKEGVYVVNSWGAGWGRWGHAKVTWRTFDTAFVYGAVLTGVFNDMDLIEG